jgi:hypothetical protein
MIGLVSSEAQHRRTGPDADLTAIPVGCFTAESVHPQGSSAVGLPISQELESGESSGQTFVQNALMTDFIFDSSSMNLSWTWKLLRLHPFIERISTNGSVARFGSNDFIPLIKFYWIIIPVGFHIKCGSIFSVETTWPIWQRPLHQVPQVRRQQVRRCVENGRRQKFICWIIVKDFPLEIENKPGLLNFALSK